MDRANSCPEESRSRRIVVRISGVERPARFTQTAEPGSGIRNAVAFDSTSRLEVKAIERAAAIAALKNA